MKPRELWDECQARLKSGSSLIALVKPAGRIAGWPRGELACVNTKGEQVYHYSIGKIMKWLSNNCAADIAAGR